MGYPVGKEYREQSNITMADKLQGHLLLVHGDIDDNVNVSSTLRFADALIKANKDFDLLIVPNQSHGEGTNITSRGVAGTTSYSICSAFNRRQISFSTNRRPRSWHRRDQPPPRRAPIRNS